MQPSQLSEAADLGARMFEEQPQLEESFTIHLGTSHASPVFVRRSGIAVTVNTIKICRSAAKDDAQPVTGPSRCAGFLQTQTTRQQRRQAAAAADGSFAVLLLTVRSGAPGR